MTGMTALPQNDSPPLGRVARKRQRRVQEILRVAAEVLAEKGYYNTSLEEIAERLDLAKASLYHYFDSKEALLTACLGSVAQDAIGRLEAICGGSSSSSCRSSRSSIPSCPGCSWRISSGRPPSGRRSPTGTRSTTPSSGP
jgi:hypothetical protein